jgi:hypothetical protein
MQSKKHSLIESITNIIIGYAVAIIGQLIIFPILEKDFSAGDNIITGIFFTVLSLVRSYILRRIFTRRTEKIKSTSLNFKTSKESYSAMMEDAKKF